MGIRGLFKTLTLGALAALSTLSFGQGFDERYEAFLLANDDIYVKQNPDIVILHGEIATPILIPPPVEEFVLHPQGEGYSPSADTSGVDLTGATQVNIALNDINVDGLIDLVLKDISGGAYNQIVFAHSSGMPQFITTMDDEFRKFFEQMRGWMLDPDYFDQYEVTLYEAEYSCTYTNSNNDDFYPGAEDYWETECDYWYNEVEGTYYDTSASVSALWMSRVMGPLLMGGGELPSEENTSAALEILKSKFGDDPNFAFGNSFDQVMDIPADWIPAEARERILKRIILARVLGTVIRPNPVLIGTVAVIWSEPLGDPEEDKYFEGRAWGEELARDQIDEYAGYWPFGPRVVIGEGEQEPEPYVRIPREAARFNAIFLPNLKDPEWGLPVGFQNELGFKFVNEGWILALRYWEAIFLDIGCYDNRTSRGPHYLLERALLSDYPLRFPEPVDDTLQGCMGF